MIPRFSFDEKKRLVEIAKKTISGEIELLAGCQIIADMIAEHPYHNDELLRGFVGIDSEIDHLPIGDVRKLWAPEALAEKDKEIKAFTESVRGEVIKDCRALIERFEEH